MKQPNAQESAVLGDLARQLAERAADPHEQEKIDLWKRTHGLKPVRPLVLVFPEGSWREIEAEWRFVCEDEFWRGVETYLRRRLYTAEVLRDDHPLEAVCRLPITVEHSGYGFEDRHTSPDDPTGAYHIDAIIQNERDIERITPPRVVVDWETSERRRAMLEDVLAPYLRVELDCPGNYARSWAPVDQFMKWRGIDQLFLDLVDRPAWVHEAMQRMLAVRLAELDAMEQQGALKLNNRDHYNGSGGVSYTDDLPAADAEPGGVRPCDLWGFATAQIFSEVSPAMHEEFALRYEGEFLRRFGLTYYGCCEPLHHKIEVIRRHVPNLRCLSVSAWADYEAAAAQLGDTCVLAWKPNPAVIAAPAWEPEVVRGDIERFCTRTRGAVTTMVMKDTHTCRHEPHRLAEWVRIAREAAERFPAA